LGQLIPPHCGNRARQSAGEHKNGPPVAHPREPFRNNSEEMGMRSLGIITLLSVGATAAAPARQQPAQAPMLTAKSAAAFVECFGNSQDQRAAPWWFVPKGNGGTFSNLGLPSVRQPYFLVVSDRGAHRELTIEDAAPGSPAFQGISQCM
jgi:hypothetical protein